MYAEIYGYWLCNDHQFDEIKIGCFQIQWLEFFRTAFWSIDSGEITRFFSFSGEARSSFRPISQNIERIREDIQLKLYSASLSLSLPFKIQNMIKKFILYWLSYH